VSTPVTLDAALLLRAAYAAILLLVAALDLRYRLVFHAITYPATALAVVLTPLLLGQPAWSGVVGLAIGWGLFHALYLVGQRLYPDQVPLGFGDVMIAGLLGAMLGFPAVLGGLFTGVILGGLQALCLWRFSAGERRKSHFAYGPALCLGGLLSLLGQTGS
jgi:leader peptidase (prepilin peptidase)/N-methyltransferase